MTFSSDKEGLAWLDSSVPMHVPLLFQRQYGRTSMTDPFAIDTRTISFIALASRRMGTSCVVVVIEGCGQHNVRRSMGVRIGDDVGTFQTGIEDGRVVVIGNAGSVGCMGTAVPTFAVLAIQVGTDEAGGTIVGLFWIPCVSDNVPMMVFVNPQKGIFDFFILR
mmetsp:Transcript_3752/g.5862  ORF Transcript_3752/g.5862 Transcript_3752/m.5862 type:complete len:164 (+) Transcript_3752:340-831(+)